MASAVSLEELRRVYDRERNSPELQKLPSNFYQQVGKYVKELEQELENTDTADYKAALIRDELRTARNRTEDIFKNRMAKIIREAASCAWGAGPPEHLASTEKTFFDELSEVLVNAKSSLLNPVFGHSSAEDNISSSNEMNGDNEKLDITTEVIETKKIMGKKFSMVRLLRDVPTFVGADGRNYTLHHEDVVILPKSNASILFKRGVAVPVNMENMDHVGEDKGT